MVPKAEEPKDLGRTWSLINRINQKGRRPQNKPVLLDDLPAEVLALIGKPYPELLAVGSRVSQFLGVKLSPRQPAIESLAVDSLGHGNPNHKPARPPRLSSQQLFRLALRSRTTDVSGVIRQKTLPATLSHY